MELARYLLLRPARRGALARRRGGRCRTLPRVLDGDDTVQALELRGCGSRVARVARVEAVAALDGGRRVGAVGGVGGLDHADPPGQPGHGEQGDDEAEGGLIGSPSGRRWRRATLLEALATPSSAGPNQVPDQAASSAMIRSRRSQNHSPWQRWPRRTPSGRATPRRSGSGGGGRGPSRGRPGGCCRPGRPCRTRGSSAAGPPSTGRWTSQVPPKTQCPRARKCSASSASAASASRREPYGPQAWTRSGRRRTPCARTSRDAL